jgi:hypothetical protein
MNQGSTFLFATPSAAEGIARLLDFANALTVYNTSESDAEADTRGIAMDWRVTGDDLRGAMSEFDRSGQL